MIGYRTITSTTPLAPTPTTPSSRTLASASPTLAAENAIAMTGTSTPGPKRRAVSQTTSETHPAILAAMAERRQTLLNLDSLRYSFTPDQTPRTSRHRIALSLTPQEHTIFFCCVGSAGLAPKTHTGDTRTYHAINAAGEALIADIAALDGGTITFPRIIPIPSSRKWAIAAAETTAFAEWSRLPPKAAATGEISLKDLLLNLPATWPWITDRKQLEAQGARFRDILDETRPTLDPWMIFSPRARQFIVRATDPALRDLILALGFTRLTSDNGAGFDGHYASRQPRAAISLLPLASRSLQVRLETMYDKWPFMPEEITPELAEHLTDAQGRAAMKAAAKAQANKPRCIHADRAAGLYYTDDPDSARRLGAATPTQDQIAALSRRPEKRIYITDNLASVSSAWPELTDDARCELISTLIERSTPPASAQPHIENPPEPSPRYSYDPAQIDGIRHAMRGPTTMISDDMGTGKTVQACGIADTMRAAARREGRPMTAMFIVPPDILDKWTQHLVDVTGTPFRILRIDGGTNDMPPDIARNTRFVDRPEDLTDPTRQGPDGTVALVPISRIARLGAALSARWDLIVIDEGHGLSKSTAHRTRLFFNTGTDGRIALDAGRIVQMTGTDITNRMTDYHHIVSAIIQRGNPPAETPTFTEKDFGEIFAGPPETSEPRIARLSEALDLGPRIRRLKTDIYPDLPPKLPPKTWIIRPESAAPAEIEHQNELARKLGYDADTMAALISADERRALSAELARSRIETSRHKVEPIARIVARIARPADPVLLYAHHTEIADSLGRALTRLGVDATVAHGKNTTPQERFRAGVEFNEGRWDVFVTTIQAFYAGHDTPRTRMVFFAEMDHKSWMLSQCQDRAWRRGQKRPVWVRFFTIPGSYDDIIATNILAKSRIHTIASGDDRRTMESSQ